MDIELQAKEYKNALRYSKSLKKGILRRLYNITDPVIYKIMYLKIINGRTFENIAVEVGYSTRQVQRLYKKGVQQVNKVGR